MQSQKIEIEIFFEGEKPSPAAAPPPPISPSATPQAPAPPQSPFGIGCDTSPPTKQVRDIWRMSATNHRCKFGPDVVLSLLNGIDELRARLKELRRQQKTTAPQ